MYISGKVQRSVLLPAITLSFHWIATFIRFLRAGRVQGFRHKCVDLVCVRPVEVMYIMGTGLLLLADYPCFCRRMSVKWYTLPWFSAASPTFQSRPNAHLAAPRRFTAF